ncbi:TonB-dependent receptor [Sphingomonas sp. HMP6]|uniref:TonB-dependent receptor n=1 Tax=Sphingomonas sp. HMP6 TaxID=1517551 RepID=UPI0015996495|nr:TonB-dependent receptor [Sphingomonas sp. HMP6]BCA58833.1 TonB-dependent receptor [Sphingomonas sp. HMP6]
MLNRLLYTCAASALALGIASPSIAQTAPPATPAPTSATDDTNEDIVVTAQGRSQLLANVPAAISAVTAQSLANSGANDIRGLTQLAPSLLVSSTGSEANASPRIRGIGTVGDNPGLESSVAVFIDGVYRSRAGAGLNELGEIDRIEVQRGPQGTLGGRNASAGVLSIFSKKPSFTFGGNVEGTYGNYDFYRLAGSITGPITETLAARVDGVYVNRKGFYYDAANNTDINDRDRYFLRGQLLFQPNADLSFRLIGDYTRRNEKCCAATYVDNSVSPYIGNLNDPSTPLAPLQAGGNNIVNVLRDLGQNVTAIQSPGYSRNVNVTPGRSYAGITTDWGVSGQLDWSLGGVNLTSITAYRDYKAGQGGDIDYSSVDILYRAADGNSKRQFRTFTQEIRLQGSLFEDKLDWLVGGFFANEDATITDNLRFGNQYGRFASCRIISGGGLAGLYSPTSPDCVASKALLSGAFGAAGPAIVAGFDNLDSINNKGTTLDRYTQNSQNWAVFTHNIFHVTDRFDITLGGRYTREKKKLNALFGNDNTACVANQTLLSPFLTNPGLAAVAGGVIGLSCQGNSTSELNGVAINSSRSEGRFTGTAVASWRPIDHLLVYGSFSRGYKAGGFNLDRSALKAPIASFASLGGAQALVGNLQFDAETVDAYEIGAKYSTGPFSLSIAGFRQDFSNFQLNTFNGTVFLVQSINGCKSSLAGADRDASATTGACPASDVGYGVRAQGVELEASLAPIRDLRVSLGLTYQDTKYRANLVGSANGAPLDPALRKLPGQALSNAPLIVATASAAWTPRIGSSGLSGLFYIDSRLSDDYNTGSDLFPQKGQDSFALFNARVGLRGKDERWALEFWGQNIFNQNYAQVAFNSPFQAGTTSAPFTDPQYPGGRNLFSQFLAEPRTYGVTVRGKF